MKNHQDIISSLITFYPDEVYNKICDILNESKGLKKIKSSDSLIYETKNNQSFGGPLKIEIHKDKLVSTRFTYNYYSDRIDLYPFQNEKFIDSIKDGRVIFLEYFLKEISELYNSINKLESTNQYNLSSSINTELRIWNKYFKNLKLKKSKESKNHFTTDSNNVTIETNFYGSPSTRFIKFRIKYLYKVTENVLVRKKSFFFKEKYKVKDVLKTEDTGDVKIPFSKIDLSKYDNDVNLTTQDIKIVSVLNEVNNEFNNLKKVFKEELNRKNKNLIKNKQDELERLKNQVSKRKEEFISKFDKDSNGKIDLIEENIFYKLLRKNQTLIDEFHSEGVHHLVKLSKIIKQKESVLTSILKKYISNKEIVSLKYLEKYFEESFKEYSVLTFNGVNLIMSVLKKDKITYFEIYDKFESLGVFQNSYEKSVLENGELIINELKNVNSNLNVLNDRISDLEVSIYEGLSSLNYTLEDSFLDLTNTLETELKGINSSVQVGNFINTINTYQTYKLNSKVSKLLK